MSVRGEAESYETRWMEVVFGEILLGGGQCMCRFVESCEQRFTRGVVGRAWFVRVYLLVCVELESCEAR